MVLWIPDYVRMLLYLLNYYWKIYKCATVVTYLTYLVGFKA